MKYIIENNKLYRIKVQEELSREQAIQELADIDLELGRIEDNLTVSRQRIDALLTDKEALNAKRKELVKFTKNEDRSTPKK